MCLRRAGKGHLDVGENWKWDDLTFRNKVWAAQELIKGLEAIQEGSLGPGRTGKEAL